MRTILVLAICIVLLLDACKNDAPDNQGFFSSEQQDSIKDHLEGIAIEFLQSWEPPFYPDKALTLFTQSEDFHLVIDGIEIGNYRDWAEGVPEFMAHDRNSYESYSHEIDYIETVVLSPESGVISIVYIWDSVTRDGQHERTPGAITLTCREEECGWKILHYHGSHGEPEILD